MAKSCPVNFQKINENQVRIQALFITLTACGFIFTGWVVFGIVLLYDFTVRLFISPKVSLFAQIASLIIETFNIKEQLVDSAPKIFASKIGLAFSFAIVFSTFFGLNEAATFLAIILALCAAMEAVLNYCVGCKVYTIFRYFNMRS